MTVLPHGRRLLRGEYFRFSVHVLHIELWKTGISQD